MGGIVRSPAIAKDGTLYVGAGAYLFALDAAGREKWRSFLWNAIATAPAIGADGTVYATSNAGALVALDPSNGRQKWVYRGAWGFAINSSPIIDGEGTIFFVDNNNVAHAVRPNGQPKWVQWFPGLVFSSLTLSRDDQTIYVGSSLFGARAINAKTGQLRWIAFQNMGEFATPTIGADGTIYIGSSQGEMYALNPFDGSKRWKAEHKTLLFLDQWGAITVSPAIAPNGDIVFGTKKGVLVSLTKAGAIRWERDLGDAITGAPVIDAQGAIFVGTASNKIHGVDPNTGADLWSFKTGGTVASAPALGAQGTLYAGAANGYFYSVGVGVPAVGAPIVEYRPQAPWIAPQTTDDNGNPLPCPDCAPNPLPNHPGEVKYCADMPTLSQDAQLAAHGFTTVRPGLVSSQDPVTDEFTIGGIQPGACAAHLCNNDEQQLTSAQETLLLSDVAPSSIPQELRIPCGAVEASAAADCYQFDFRKITATACTSDANCPANHRCGLACTPDPQTHALRTECPTEEREQFCIGLSLDAACGGVKTEPDDATTCFEVTECARDEDLLDEADTAPLCDGFDANNNPIKVPCELLKQQLVDPNNCPANSPSCKPKIELLAQYPGITGTAANGLMGMTVADRCKLAQLENAGTNDKGGSPSSPGKNKGKAKWGIDLKAGVDSGYEMKPLPFGLAIPSVHAGGGFGIFATVMGRPITVLGVEGKAALELCTIEAGAIGTLFNNDISLFGGDSPSVFNQAGDLQYCDKFFEAAKNVGGEAKNALVEAAAVYNKIKSFYDTASGAVKEVSAAARVITKGMCKDIVPDKVVDGPLAQAYAAVDPNDDLVLSSTGTLQRTTAGGPNADVYGNPFCNRPLTNETAAAIVNKVIERYEGEVKAIAQRMTNGVNEKLNGYLDKAVQKGFGRANGKISDTLKVPASLGQSFSLIGAEAVFPIGPLALVLEVQGTGGWAITGGLDYGVSYDLAKAFSTDGGKIASAKAEANVGPSAHVDVDVYVGVGFDFGLAGASVGIGGKLTLVKIELPAFASLEAYVEKDTAPEPPAREWPTELKHLKSPDLLLTQSTFRMKLEGAFGVRAHMEALNGELSLRLRVKLLFFKKKWQKRIAKFKGFSKDFEWVVSGGADFKVKMPTPNLSVMPPIPFPKFPRVSPSDFPSLPSLAQALTSAGENVTGLSAAQIQQKFDDTFKTVDKIAGYQLPNWDQLVQTLPAEAQTLYGELKSGLDGKLGVTCDPGVIIF